MFLHSNALLFEEVLLRASAAFSISEEFAAKDYWAMTMLRQVTERNPDLVFKGGTCLSKCYGAINRFSEDVDLGIPYEHATEGMRKGIKRAVVESAEALGLGISNLSETKSRREYNRYDLELPGAGRSLILETAVMTPAVPYNVMPVQSFAGSFVEEEDPGLAKKLGLLAFDVKANSLERTFADKVFAICDYYLMGSMPPRQSRHIYDLSKLLDVVDLDAEMLNLIGLVKAQRAGAYGNPSASEGVDLASLLEEIKNKEAYRADYERVTMPLLYERVDYDEASAALGKIADFLNG